MSIYGIYLQRIIKVCVVLSVSRILRIKVENKSLHIFWELDKPYTINIQVYENKMSDQCHFWNTVYWLWSYFTKLSI